MGAAGDVVAEERLVRRGGVELLQVVDRVVRHAGDHVVAGVVAEREDLRGVAEEVRRPLVGLAAHEPVEVLEAHADGHWVNGPAALYRYAGVLWFLPNHEVA
jgi:hypothetical protein